MRAECRGEGRGWLPGTAAVHLCYDTPPGHPWAPAPALSSFLNTRYYDGRLLDARGCAALRLPEEALPVPDPVALIDVSGFEDMNGPSYFNVMEACVVVGVPAARSTAVWSRALLQATVRV